MAKDGTRRGGARVGAGRKPKALTDKINEALVPRSLNCRRLRQWKGSMYLR